MNDSEREAHREEVIAKAREIVKEADELGYTRPAIRVLADELAALDSYEERHKQ
jgi:hypothetical protein